MASFHISPYLFVRYLRYLYRVLFVQRKKLLAYVITEASLTFDDQKNIFRITRSDFDWDERVSFRSRIIKSLINIHPTTYIKLNELKTSYYENCLTQYIDQRLNEGLKNCETCWFKNAQNNKCIGWIDPTEPFTMDSKVAFMAKLIQRKPGFVNSDAWHRLTRDDDGFVYFLSTDVFYKDEKVLLLCNSIEKKGFSQLQSSFSPIIIGYSTTRKLHMVMAGRHRIAALKYLMTQGKVEGKLPIKCHMVHYPYESLVFTRPYNHKCRICDQF